MRIKFIITQRRLTYASHMDFDSFTFLLVGLITAGQHRTTAGQHRDTAVHRKILQETKCQILRFRSQNDGFL